MNGRVPRAGFYPRAALCGLLLIALADPRLPWPGAAPSVYVLLDDSASMGKGLDELWPGLARRLADLPAAAKLGFIRFAAVPLAEFPPKPIADPESRRLLDSPALPRRLPLDRGATDLAAALETALRQAAPGEPAAILLASDLRQSRGDAEAILETARRAGIPVYVLAPPAIAGDGRIADAHFPPAARVGAMLPIAVRLAGPPGASGTLSWRVGDSARDAVAVEFSQTGESAVALRAGPCPPGSCRGDLELELPGDPLPANNARTLLVDVPGPRPVLYAATAAGRPAADGRAREGWTVRRVAPADFPRDPAALDRYSAVVLDDLPLESLPPPSRSALVAAVRRQGLGLLVLGGPNSFGRGGYRHSELEDILPVVAEGGDTRSAASVLFLLDKSGSMDLRGGAAGGFAMARRAVLETLKGLWRQDRVGIIVFDAEAREVLPLGPRADPERALDLALAPAGGTRLAPALEMALERLSRADTRQRLLVLVSDGRFVDSDFAGLEKKLAAGDIEFIALAVGEDAALPALERLASAGRGRVLRVGRSAELPRLARGEVERERAAVETGTTLPVAIRPLPFPIGGAAWPALSAHAVTTPRPEAAVYWQSAQGDPLLAEWRAGAGRVLALPGGLADWARTWIARPDFGRLAAGLVERATAATADSGLELRVDSQPGRLEFEIDALAADPARWAEAPNAEVRLAWPSGASETVRVQAAAPGLYRGSLPAGPPGIYRLSVAVGERRAMASVVHGLDEEADFSGEGAAAARHWLEKGLIEPVPDGGMAGLATRSAPASPRRALLGSVGMAYLLLIIHERFRPFRFWGISRKKT